MRWFQITGWGDIRPTCLTQAGRQASQASSRGCAPWPALSRGVRPHVSLASNPGLCDFRAGLSTSSSPRIPGRLVPSPVSQMGKLRLSVFVFYDCCNKRPQRWWLSHPRVFCYSSGGHNSDVSLTRLNQGQQGYVPEVLKKNHFPAFSSFQRRLTLIAA